MKDLKDLDFKWSKIIKILGIVVLGIIVLSLGVNLVIGPIFSQIKGSSGGSYGVNSKFEMAPSASNIAYDNGMNLSYRNAYGEMDMVEDEYKNIAGDAEAFEVKEYSATIETSNLDKTCSRVVELKGRDYVVFEGSNVNEYGCNFTFKVKKDNVNEILAIIEEMNPRDLSENVKSIKRQIEDFTSQEEILKTKLASIEETLGSAISSYDEISALATRTNDAESLTKIITSKLSILERLTQEKINISAQLERLSRSKAEQLERLEYTYFYVNVYENKILDPQYIKDSWVSSAKQFVRDINRVVQDLSLRLVTLFFSTFRYLVYLFVILIVIKYCYRFGKYIWKK